MLPAFEDGTASRDFSIYHLLDQLKHAGWVHPPHVHNDRFAFTELARHHSTGATFDLATYHRLFPAAPGDERETLLPTPSVPPVSEAIIQTF